MSEKQITMAVTTTPNASLAKPDYTEAVDIAVINANMDKIDDKIGTATQSKAGIMSSADKTKLDSIATGSQANQNAFSNVKVGSTTVVADSPTDTLEIVAGGEITMSADASTDKVTITYTHPSKHQASIITQDANNRMVTDAEKSTWNGKADTTTATTTANGLMSKEDKSKLDGVATGANNYTHPTTHPASIITQDANNRMVTDTEKSTWNNKAGTTVATTSANGLMSKEDKSKLDGVATGANNYTHPNDANTRHVTDTEKSTWNNKANTTPVTATANGLMSKEDKSKLDGVATGANNYTHPDTHPYSMITGAPTSLPANGGNADTVDGKHVSDLMLRSMFSWSGQAGQPTWLWGGNNVDNYMVYNPANFSVANANTVKNRDLCAEVDALKSTSGHKSSKASETLQFTVLNKAVSVNVASSLLYLGTFVPLYGGSIRVKMTRTGGDRGITMLSPMKDGNSLYWMPFKNAGDVAANSTSYLKSSVVNSKEVTLDIFVEAGRPYIFVMESYQTSVYGANKLTVHYDVVSGGVI